MGSYKGQTSWRGGYVLSSNVIIVPLGSGSDYITDPANNVSSYNMALMDGSLTNIKCTLGPIELGLPENQDVMITEMRWLLAGGGSFYPQRFGNTGGPLTNGIRFTLETTDDGGTTWTETADFAKYMVVAGTHTGAIRRHMDLDIFTRDITDTASSRDDVYKLVRVWDPARFFGRNEFILRHNERLVLTVRDDMTAHFTGTDAQMLVYLMGKVV